VGGMQAPNLLFFILRCGIFFLLEIILTTETFLLPQKVKKVYCPSKGI
jgi:hypothetical protein